MHTHPTPSAHVSPPLPPGDLPMRDRCPHLNPELLLETASACGRVHRSFFRQFAAKYPQAPIGTWWVFEQRTDDQGEVWNRKDQGIHYVVDDFGFLVRAKHEGGAA